MSDATAVLHFIVGYNNEMEVQEEAEQAGSRSRGRQSNIKRERGREGKRGTEREQSRRSDKTNHISIKMRKAFCGCRCLHSLLLPVFPLFFSPLHPFPALLHRAAAHCIVAAYPPCVQRALFSVPSCLCACLSVSASLFIARSLLALHFACKKHNNQKREGEGERGRDRQRERQSNCLPDRRRRLHKPPKINNANGRRHR